MMQIRGMPVCDLEYLANGFVDLCGPVPYKQRNLGLGKCIVSAPIMLFVEQVETQQFVEALQLSCADRILAVDYNNPNRFLVSGPKKVHIHHVMEALLWTRIPYINCYVFGMKSNWNSFAWIDRINEHNPTAEIYVDIGWYLPAGQEEGDICLVKPKIGYTFAGGNVTTYPMLSSSQRTSMGETFGTFCYTANHREGEEEPEIKKVKIYSTLGHALKAFGRATNFGTLPKNTKQMKARVSQGNEFLRFAQNFEMFNDNVTLVRIEVTLKKTGTFMTTMNRAWEAGSELASGMDTLLVPVETYGDEARRLLDIAANHSSTHSRDARQLTYVEKTFAAHLLNAFGHTNVDIVKHLTQVSGERGYTWEPAVPTDAPVDRAPPASTWEDIVQHVQVSRAPRGRLCIRKKNGSMLKVGRTARELHLHVHCHLRML